MNTSDELRFYANQMKPSGLGGRGKALSPDRAMLLERAADENDQLRAILRHVRGIYGHRMANNTRGRIDGLLRVPQQIAQSEKP